MRTRKIAWLTSILLYTFLESLCGQGVTRPHGIGLRPSFWSMSDNTFGFNLSAGAGRVGGQVNVSGIGSWLFFFSRVNQHLFMQFELGAVGTAHSEGVNLEESDTDISTIIPILVGLRYDLLSGRSTSRLQPYLACAAGPYWSTAFSVKNEGSQETIFGESKQKYGGYIGGGVNLLLSNWMAINFDTRYHFIDGRVNSEYSGMEYALGLCLMWGRNKELFQIKDIKLLVKDLYPAYFPFYNTYPLALVTIHNTAGYDIEVNVQANIEGFSQRIQESGPIHLQRGETRDIPVQAMLNSALLQIQQRRTAALDLLIEARAGATVRKQVSASLMIHHRNAWDGDAEKLPLYVTAEEPTILSRARAMTAHPPASPMPENLAMATAVFDSLSASGMTYRRDPNIPYYEDDRVQFADETLREHGGDCDDLVVLYATLLQSLGIPTAFIEVRDPSKEIGHLYLMFDSGVALSDRLTLTSNEKRIVIRTEMDGSPRVWIPVETTLIGQPFTEAWNAGARQWYQDTELRQGIAEGWVKWVNVSHSRNQFKIP